MWNSIPLKRRGRRQIAARLSWVTLCACMACSVYDESLLTPRRGAGAGGYAGSHNAAGGRGGASAGGTGADGAGGAGADAGLGGVGEGGAAPGTGGQPSGGGGRAGAPNTSTGGAAADSSTGGNSGGSPAGTGGAITNSGGSPADAGAAGAAGAGGGESCTDGTINGSETGKDCGGDCAACPLGQPCAIDGDCQSAHCIAKVCSVVNCTDKLKNGRETDVDCGGSDCPDCLADQGCGEHGDCVTGVCTTLRCATQRTCGEVKSLVPTSPDGLYTIDPGTGPAFPAYCDMTSASGGWTRVGFEPAGAGGSQVNGALNHLGVSVGTYANVAGKTAAGLIGTRFKGVYTELRITWAANYAQMTVSTDIFVDTAQPAIPVSKVTSSSTALTGWLSGGAVFCRAASSTFSPGDTSWALVPSNNADTSCGCSGMNWSGNGIYYGGANPADVCTAWGGAFAGVRAVGEQKGGVTSVTELVLWVR